MDYHKSLHSLFKENGWSTTTLIPEDSALNELPKNWEKELYHPPKWSRRSVFARLFPTLFNCRSLFKMVRSYTKAITPRIEKEKGHKTILFFETFNTFHLYTLAFILPFIPIKNVHLWILYRYDSKQLFFKGKRDRKLLKFFQKILPNKRLSLFADTDVLAKELSTFFKQKVNLIPIPHTHGIAKSNAKQSRENISLWWPGVPRRPKGLHTIQKLCTLKAPTGVSLSLRVSEKTPDLKEPSNFKLKKIPENLTRKKYLNYLNQSDAILLPYNIWNYQYSSSGIFIEAISAQKVPFVSPGLWISNELEKHDLKELILDFDDPCVLDKIVELTQSPDVQVKLSQMSQHYREFHNESHTAKILLNYI